MNKSAVKKIIFAFLLLLQSTITAKAEIIDLRNEEKTFGDWTVFCEIDDMMNIAHCKIASKFYENTAVITIQPTSKFSNQFFVIIPQIKIGNFVTMRIDQNEVILSRTVQKEDFGLIPFLEEEKNSAFSQMKSGKFLFLRFNSIKSEKEITAKLNLEDFRRALAYYNNKTSQ
jgi:hypothetical protein